MIVLHPAERFQPVPVDGFLADSDVQARQVDGAWAAVPGPYRPQAVPGGSINGSADQGRLAAVELLCGGRGGDGARPTVYGAYHAAGTNRPPVLALDPLNPYSPEVPPNPLFAQVHEGDRELVTVIPTGPGSRLQPDTAATAAALCAPGRMCQRRDCDRWP